MALPVRNAECLPCAKRARTEPLQAGRPSSPPESPGCGHRRVTASGGSLVPPHGSQGASSGSGEPLARNDFAARDYASSLPADLLDLIFSRLPVSFHGTCALVCRHWYSHLPGIRLRITGWLKQHPLLQSFASYSLAKAFPQRIAPWLASQQCRHLPLLQLLYQDWVEQAGPGAQECVMVPGAQRAARWLTAGVLYSLHQQWRRVAPLELTPAVIEAPPVRVTRTCFSDSGLFLALNGRLSPQMASMLRLYGWRDGRWCSESLLRPSPQPVRFFFFHSLMGSEKLITVHESQQILSWSRDPAGWYPASVYSHRPPGRIVDVVPALHGDLVSKTETGRRGMQQFLFSCYLDSCQSWDHTRSCDYHKPDAMTLRCDQLVLAVSEGVRTGGRRSIHIWKPGLDGGAPTRWACRVSALWTRTPVLSLSLSPDGSHVLGLMKDRQRLHLWAIDGQCRLQPKLTLPGEPAIPLRTLARSHLFSHDSQHLAIPVSLGRIQLWERTPAGGWQRAGTLSAAASHMPERSLERCLLSHDGQALIRVTDREPALWHKTAEGHWQPAQEPFVVMGRTLTPVLGPFMLLLWGPAWVTASGHEGVVKIHSPDSFNCCVIQACWSAGAKIQAAEASPDALSLALVDHNGALTLLQVSSRSCATGVQRQPMAAGGMPPVSQALVRGMEPSGGFPP